VGRVSRQAAPAGLGGTLSLPPRARGLVVLVQGHQAVAGALFEAGFGTLSMDAQGDVEMLARRVVGAIDRLAADALIGDLPEELRELPIACCGDGAGAEAALLAAAARPDRIAVLTREWLDVLLAGPGSAEEPGPV
jgi:hypothetical protein